MNNKNVIFEQVSKCYAKNTIALNEISFDIETNKITVLLGPNGAGKSTIMRIMATLTHATSGNVTIFGRDSRKDYAYIRSKLGYVGQKIAVDKLLTVEDNLNFAAKLNNIPIEKIKSRIKELLEQFKLVSYRHKIIFRLSEGIQRRVDIAMGIIHHPSLLLLDEPTANLDPESRAQLWNAIDEEIDKYKTTVVYSTHYLEEADKNAQRILLIDHGNVIGNGTSKELKNKIGNETIILDFHHSSVASHAAHTISELIKESNTILANKRLLLGVDNPESHLSILRKLLNDNHLACQSITLSKPSLNDVYFLMTGENFEKVNANGKELAERKARSPWQ